ncbi:MAG: hypothetical protein ACRDTZ_01220 [Pseudonocardiaceae bacterium]
MPSTDSIIDTAFRALMSQLLEFHGAVAQQPSTRVNATRLQSALEHITAHPEEHDQSVWSRPLPTGGTAGCLAYHAALVAGYTMDPGLADIVDGLNAYVRSPSGQVAEHVEQVARRELGLDAPQARRLFDPLQKIDSLWAIAEEITDGQVTREKCNA